jgi:hypothetical protein
MVIIYKVAVFKHSRNWANGGAMYLVKGLGDKIYSSSATMSIVNGEITGLLLPSEPVNDDMGILLR